MTLSIIESPSPSRKPRDPRVRVDTLLIHHTGTDDRGRWSNGSALNTLLNPKNKVSAHYLVFTTGEVHRLVPEDHIANHAGLSRLPWEPWRKGGSVNARSIGIEVVNPGDGKTPFTEAQYAALAELVSDIVRRMGWDTRPPWHNHTLSGMSYVLGHRDVACFEDGRFGRKTDPADNFDWGRIRKALGGPK